MGLDTVELVMEFEAGFGIEIPDEVAEKLVSVRDVRDYVVKEYTRLGKQADPQQIFEKIRDMTEKISNVDREKIGLDTTFVEDLRLD